MKTLAVEKSSLLNCPAPGMGGSLLEPMAKLAVRCKNGRLESLMGVNSGTLGHSQDNPGNFSMMD